MREASINSRAMWEMNLQFGVYDYECVKRISRIQHRNI